MSEVVTQPGVNGPWPVLDVKERRVLGVLVEKAKTTPDSYPLSINALVTGSNQKSNRDPILDLDEGDIEDTLNRLKNQALVTRVQGGRVERWRHLLYECWHVDKIDLAILAELLLRGPQTEGELRTRASRMEPIDDLDHLRGYLRPLMERGLVIYLTPEERRGAVLTHGFHGPQELERLRKYHQGAAQSEPVSRPSPPLHVSAGATPAPVRNDERTIALESALTTVKTDLEKTRQELAAMSQLMQALEKLTTEMRSQLDATRTELRELKQSLGA